MLEKVRSLGVSTKIMIVVLMFMIVVVAGNYVVFVSGFRKESLRALMDKASAFTAAAEQARNHVGRLQSQGAFNSESLIEDARAHIEHGGSYEETVFYTTLPVVAGWTVAAEAADKEGIDFHVTAFNARNPNNTPTPGSFEERLLQDLNAQVRAGGEPSIGGIDEQTNTLHFLRAIELDASCMMCHGDPATSPTGDGMDMLGFKMEGWEIGDTHGAFAVAMPLGPVDAQVAGFLRDGMAVAVPLVVVFGLGFLWLLRAMLGTPIRAIVDRIKDIAEGEGDLTGRIDVRRGDELGELGAWFNAFIERIQETITSVANSTREVAAAATEIATCAEQTAAGLVSQQEQTAQVSAAVAQMSGTVNEVAGRSADAASAAESSGREAAQGGCVVAETVEEMNGIAAQVNQASLAVADLGKKGEQIGEIIGVINDIADQTNLLALNAAIEAARAGEHGRGFAVVADEVRKLAERTTNATKEVAESIRQIRSETGTAIEQIEAGTSRVSRGVELAHSAGEALARIVESSRSVQSMVQSIAAASEEQSAASTQIARSVEQIDSVTRESLEGARRSAQAAAQLSSQAESLRTLVGQFKI